ncbi:FAD-binding oxidoreductase [Streptosporangium roseum]|uniref:FAD linked oxidase-like protein n=1 Tax=Streptosporangium roseum (strain ATCC 12428 / DSM 43021 / JCM 3005 / KCTC 9067 / NCIMB 10171 / NRRL 2505 / NI 9100) TaxID=479432 RepID=D2AZJ6_STRRD|nr:FAD-binding oxidoreductase [Streptosporangium roseum]ACZ85241.1 FAD linked oxidase-like protein [Streptosporangium roseum DSM 43021]
MDALHETGGALLSGALHRTGVTIREAGPDDAVAGVSPRWVALPETTEEVAALMRVSAEHDLAVTPVGGGTRLHWAPPPERCDLLIDTCCLNQVLEHASGDLVVRVQAGVTMDSLAETLAAEGQELSLDVPLDGATVGGVLATATAGPRRFRHGTARDLLIGVTVVLADGTTARSGGKVVKNVAGYDLGKLFTGSYGTLGVITEAAFRLHPIPDDRRWIIAEPPGAPGSEAVRGGGPPDAPGWPSSPPGLDVLAAELAASQAEPSAIEVDWPDARRGPVVAVLVEGTAADARARAVRALMAGHGTARITTGPPGWWGTLPGEDVLLEVRVPPSRAGGALRAVMARGLPAHVRGSMATAALQVALPPDVGGSAFAEFVSGVRDDLGRLGGRLTVLTAPQELAGRVDRWGPVGALPLLRRVKERFDPGRRMSPGRSVGGI